LVLGVLLGIAGIVPGFKSIGAGVSTETRPPSSRVIAPGTKDFSSIAQTLLSNARSDAEDKKVTGQRDSSAQNKL